MNNFNFFLKKDAKKFGYVKKKTYICTINLKPIKC